MRDCPVGNLTFQRIHTEFNQIYQSTYNFETILKISGMDTIFTFAIGVDYYPCL